MIDPLPPHVLAQANNETVHTKHPGKPRAGKSAKGIVMNETEAIKLLVETLEDVIGAHADPGDNGYNECDKPGDECQWCVHAKQLINYFSSRPAPVDGKIARDTQLFNEGYRQGHHDTVESCYIDILPCDMAEIHKEDVLDIVKYEPAPAEAWAVKGPRGELRMVAPGWSKFECICDYFGFPTTDFPLKRIGAAWKNALALGFRAVRVEVREVGE